MTQSRFPSLSCVPFSNNPPPHRTSSARRAALGSLVFLALATGCGNENGQVEASAQAPPNAAGDAAAALQPEEQLVDLSRLGFDEGDAETAAFGVIEFSDFGCVHCAAFHAETYPALQEEFVASGDVLWKYIPISIAGFPHSETAGGAAICAAEQGRFADMRDHLFAQREEWLASSGESELFVGYATDLGLSPDAFLACLTHEATLARVEENNAMARRIGVSATPTFIVAGTPVRGAPPLENFQTALREMVAEARAAPAEN